MKESKQSKITRIVLEVLDSYFKTWNPSPKTVEVITFGVLKYANQHPDIMKDNFELKNILEILLYILVRIIQIHN